MWLSLFLQVLGLHHDLFITFRLNTLIGYEDGNILLLLLYICYLNVFYSGFFCCCCCDKFKEAVNVPRLYMTWQCIF